MSAYIETPTTPEKSRAAGSFSFIDRKMTTKCTSIIKNIIL